jgi:hypothetical protein
MKPQINISYPLVEYRHLMDEQRQRKFTRNDIKAFVHKIFAMYERATCAKYYIPAEDFLPYLAEDVYFDFPNYQVHNHQEFCIWHKWIHDQLESDDHVIDSIKVEFLADGKYLVQFAVVWKALFKAGHYFEGTFLQKWVVREDANLDNPVLETYLVAQGDFMQLRELFGSASLGTQN